MIKIIGALLIGLGLLVFRMLLPRNGRLHPLATAPVLEDVIPFGIVASLSVGLILILATGWAR